MDEQLQWALARFPQPAFYTEDGIVRWSNPAAQPAVFPGLALDRLMEPPELPLPAGESGLRLSVRLGGQDYDIAVRNSGSGLLFLADPPRHTQEAAEAVMKVSASLRRSLQGVAASARELFDRVEELEEPATQAMAAELNRGLYQLLRLSGQLTTGGELLYGNYPLRLARTDLKELLDHISDSVSPLLSESGRRLHYQGLSAPLPAHVDGALVERAVLNLLANALAYTPAGGCITLAAERREQCVLIRVSDTGEGIPTEVMATLFERYMLRSVGDSRWGTGLGLPMVREIARLHGGALMVTNRPSGGTDALFTLSLERGPRELASPQLRYDYLSGYHHALVELSDSLASSFYDPARVL